MQQIKEGSGLAKNGCEVLVRDEDGSHGATITKEVRAKKVAIQWMDNMQESQPVVS